MSEKEIREVLRDLLEENSLLYQKMRVRVNAASFLDYYPRKLEMVLSESEKYLNLFVDTQNEPEYYLSYDDDHFMPEFSDYGKTFFDYSGELLEHGYRVEAIELVSSLQKRCDRLAAASSFEDDYGFCFELSY